MLLEFEQKAGAFIRANELFRSSDKARLPAAKVLLAVSGGADSIALLYVMQALRSENVLGAELLCAHINHQLRGPEADLDEDFVVAQAAELKLAIRTKRVDVREFAGRNKLSIETAARQVRIKSLLEIARANNCDCVATAHQQNDNAETILQRLARGTGFRGLGGIWPMRVFGSEFNFVRPLLCVGRDEIIEYLKQRNLKWRQDHTNADCTYRRNYIRHRLLPALQRDCNGSVVEQLSRLSESARRFYKLVCSCADEVWPGLADCTGEGTPQGGNQKITLDLKILLAQSQPVVVELVRRSLTALDCGERDLTQRHYESILQLAKQNVSGKRAELPGGFLVLREYGNLIFSRPQKSEIRSRKTEVRSRKSEIRSQKSEIRSQKTEVRSRKTEVRNLPSVLCPLSSVVLEVPGQTRFRRYLIEASVLDASTFAEATADKRCSMPVSAWPSHDGLDARRKTKSRIENRESRIKFVEGFDFDKIKQPLVVRFRQTGERFTPLGLGQEKKVGKFLTAAQVPQEVRQKILIVADGEKIIWVWPIRISEKAKVTSVTRKILQLQITVMPIQAK